MHFESRKAAGVLLGRRLVELALPVDCVLGLVRGGVVVAAEVARLLQKPLGCLVVRKIGHPQHREFAVGALSEDGGTLLDPAALEQSGVDPGGLDAVIAEERERLEQYCARFHPAGLPALERQEVLLVDDGLATGATTEAAVHSARRRRAASVRVAAPVAATGAIRRLERVADQVIVLWADPQFAAVGQYYRRFPQNTDEEVLELLRPQ